MTDHLDRTLDALDLRADLEDIELDREQLQQIALLHRSIRREASETRELLIEEARRIRLLVKHQGELLMANLDAVNAALDATSTGLDSIGTELTQLAGQIGELVAGTVSQADLDALATKAQALADRTGAIRQQADDLIEPDAGETTTTP